MNEYDSTADTLLHISKVQKLLFKMMLHINFKSETHDCSKLKSPEKEILDIHTPKLKETVFGSEEYMSCLKEMQESINHHYLNNGHHPEHYKNGISGMTLVDLLEMICDWKAATERNKDGDINKSIEINQKRFGIDSQLQQVLVNTCRLF